MYISIIIMDAAFEMFKLRFESHISLSLSRLTMMQLKEGEEYEEKSLTCKKLVR